MEGAQVEVLRNMGLLASVIQGHCAREPSWCRIEAVVAAMTRA